MIFRTLPAFMFHMLTTPGPYVVIVWQLLINSLRFAEEVWASRPARFVKGEASQQAYANAIKGNYSHSGMPLGFFNHCWRKKSSGINITKLPTLCGLVTYHATCLGNAPLKQFRMNETVEFAKSQRCRPPLWEASLTRTQLSVYSRRQRMPVWPRSSHNGRKATA